MLALVIAVGFLAALGLTYFAVYKIKPQLFKVSAALGWKACTLNVEIRSSPQRTLPGKAGDDQPDP